jgi:phosphoserine phosphatase
VRSVGDATPLRRDAREVVSALHRLGYAVGAVCSDVGFSPDRLRDELGLDFVAANQFEVRDGVLTGGLSEPVIDRAGKAAALAHFAGLHGVPLAQTVAVGAGVNDLDLLQTAGMALACTGASSRPDDYLDSVLFVLGAGVDAAEAVRANR